LRGNSVKFMAFRKLFCIACLVAFTFAPLASRSARASVCPFREADIAEVNPS
jgi:hypothetical protein